MVEYPTSLSIRGKNIRATNYHAESEVFKQAPVKIRLTATED